MGRAGQVDVQIRARSSEEKLSRQPSAGRPAEGVFILGVNLTIAKIY